MRILFWTAFSLAAVSGPVLAQPREYAYVAYGSGPILGPYTGAVAVVDTVTREVDAIIPLDLRLPSVTSQPPNGRFVYAHGFDRDGGYSQDIAVIDPTTDRVDHLLHLQSVGFVPWAFGPGIIFQPPDWRFAWVRGIPDRDSWVIAVIDTQTGDVRTIPLGNRAPYDLTFNQNGDSAYVSEETWPDRQGFLRWIDTSSLDFVLLRIGQRVGGVAYNPRRDEVYVTNESPPEINIIRGLDFVGSIDFSQYKAAPVAVTFDPTGDFAEVIGGRVAGEPPSVEAPDFIWKVRADAQEVVGSPIDLSEDPILAVRRCSFSADGAHAYSIYNTGIPPPIHESIAGLIQIDTQSHAVTSRVHRSSFDDFFLANDFALTTDPNYAVVGGGIVGGAGFLWMVNLSQPEMQLETELAFPREVNALAMSTHEPIQRPRAAYVSLTNRNSVAVFDTRPPFDLLTQIPAGFSPQQVAISADDRYAYVTNTGTHSVSRIDIRMGTVTEFPVGFGAFEEAITPNGNLLFLSSAASDSVYVVNTTTDPPTVIDTIRVGSGPTSVYGMAVTPNGDRLYAAAKSGPRNYLAVIDTMSLSVVGEVDPVCGDTPYELAITPNGAFAYVTCPNMVAVVGVDPMLPTYNTRVATINIFNRTGVAASPDGAFVYVLHPFDDTVSVIGTDTNEVVGTIPVGRHPNGVAFTRGGAFAFVSNGLADISVIDVASRTVTATLTLPVGTIPGYVAAR